jgi:bisphosphoglycerate-dependent phosphoglycerate mutase
VGPLKHTCTREAMAAYKIYKNKLMGILKYHKNQVKSDLTLMLIYKQSNMDKARKGLKNINRLQNRTNADMLIQRKRNCKDKYGKRNLNTQHRTIQQQPTMKI